MGRRVKDRRGTSGAHVERDRKVAGVNRNVGEEVDHDTAMERRGLHDELVGRYGHDLASLVQRKMDRHEAE